MNKDPMDFLDSNWKAKIEPFGEVELEIRGGSIRLNISEQWYNLGIVEVDRFLKPWSKINLEIKYKWDKKTKSVVPR